MKKRVLTAAGLIPCVVGVLCLNSPYVVMGTILLVLWLGFREITNLVGAPSRPPVLPTLAVLFGFWTELTVRGARYEHYALYAGAFSVLVGAFCLVRFSLRKELNWGLMASLRADLAGLWFAGPLITLFALHQFGAGPGWFTPAPQILLAFVPIWVGDTTAIFAGRAFGRHPLWPDISPNKTWEGSLANFVACVAAGTAMGEVVSVGWLLGLACGVIAGTLGQAGDLFESWIKRTVGVKDSGSLLPGHGGLLDRMDSVLFAAPAICLLLIFTSPVGGR